MTLNRQTFRTRTITAIVFAAVMLAGLLWNHWSFFILFSIIHFGCWIEYQKLVELIDPGYKERTPFHKYGVMIAGWSLMLWFCSAEYSIFGFRLHELGFWMGLLFAFVLPISELLFTSNIRLKNIAHSVFGLVYISLSLGLMVDISNFEVNNDIEAISFKSYNWAYPVLIVFALWINDTMAYLVGSVLGKTPFSKISPKKTWEGTIGGILLSIGLAYLIPTIFHIRLIDPGIAVIIAAAASVVGVVGDLFESKLKRMAGVKDSGQIMPGHGGFLDRFDSLLFAIPVTWVLLKPCLFSTC